MLIDRIVLRLGDMLATKQKLMVTAISLIIRNIQKGSWTANAPLTIAVKNNNLPLQDKGQLLGSISGRIEGDFIFIGSNHVAARILHEGGKITPKRAKYLTLPASSKTRTYMRMYGMTPRACIQGMQSAGFSIWKPKEKNVILSKKGKTGKTNVLFILKKSVNIPARKFMEIGNDGKAVLEKIVVEGLKP